MTHGKALLHYGLIHRPFAAGKGPRKGVAHFVKSWAITALLVAVAVAWANAIRHDLPTILAVLHRYL